MVLDSAIMMRHWYTSLDTNTLTLYTEISSLTKQHHMDPIIWWEGAVNILSKWLIIIDIILVPQEMYPIIYEMATLNWGRVGSKLAPLLPSPRPDRHATRYSQTFQNLVQQELLSGVHHPPTGTLATLIPPDPHAHSRAFTHRKIQHYQGIKESQPASPTQKLPLSTTHPTHPPQNLSIRGGGSPQ